MLLFFCSQFIESSDNSFLSKSFQSPDASVTNPGKKVNESFFPFVNVTEKKKKKRQALQKIRPINLVYNAKQVIERGSDPLGSSSFIPGGTNFIGKLLTGIDTRDNSSSCRVILPYSVNHPKGGRIEKNSILVGTATSSGENEKVFIRFSKIITPSGEEFKIDAEALSSSDYSPGLLADYHSNADSRLMGSIALTMVSAAAEVLTQKTMMGGGALPMGIGVNQPDPTLKNAALQGVSSVAKEEASKSMQGAQSAQGYQTVSADTDLIIHLLAPFSMETINNDTNL
ncbi:MAG: TrbI/VirB10 family protein [Bacteriovoracaceae bacterium]|nr:TrbI/VirB10 family protein [Bacteriovoracaceae bacterium]